MKNVIKRICHPLNNNESIVLAPIINNVSEMVMKRAELSK